MTNLYAPSAKPRRIGVIVANRRVASFDTFAEAKAYVDQRFTILYGGMDETFTDCWDGFANGGDVVSIEPMQVTL